MQCNIIDAGPRDARGWRAVRCINCGTLYKPTPDAPEQFRARCFVSGKGPGTELTKLLALLGCKPRTECGCKAKAAEMDRLGVDGCRIERETLKLWLADAYSGLTWSEVSAAAARAVVTGLAFRINPTDVCGSLVELAIERAEATA